jgi:hypothetical protein
MVRDQRLMPRKGARGLGPGRHALELAQRVLARRQLRAEHRQPLRPPGRPPP